MSRKQSRANDSWQRKMYKLAAACFALDPKPDLMKDGKARELRRHIEVQAKKLRLMKRIKAHEHAELLKWHKRSDDAEDSLIRKARAEAAQKKISPYAAAAMTAPPRKP